MSTDISPAAQRYVGAVNAFDIDGVMATFAPNALVNDNHREFADPDSIRAPSRSRPPPTGPPEHRPTRRWAPSCARVLGTALRTRYRGESGRR